MSFELRSGKSLRKEIRRISRKQIDDGLEQLTGHHKGSRDEAVHEARKSFKRLRAVLRLVRPVIGESSYREENACFRDAGRPLTRIRDAKVLIETLDHLTERFQEHLAPRTFDETRKTLQANLRSVRHRVLQKQDAFAVVAASVRRARERIKAWADVPNKWWAVGKGLEDVYCRAGDAHRETALDPTIENLHEWRKQVRYLRYQLQVLRPLWPERLEELADEAGRLADLLGDDHDLAVLRQILTGHQGRFSDPDDTEVLLALVDRRRAELTQEALLLGGRFFQETPGRFARQLKGYWKIWRRQPDPQTSI